MKNLPEAMVSFQSKLKPINKDAQNPFFKSDYLTLSGILDSVIPLLSSCGLFMSQPMKVDGDKTILITRITHTSGETLESEMILPPHPDPQKFGSLITYYKRYQLQSMLGVSSRDEDDDANSSNSLTQAQSDHVMNQRQRPVAPTVDGRPATDQQKKAIYAISKSKNIDMPTIDSFPQATKWINDMNNKGK